MRYRQLDASGDYALGGTAVFLANSPEAVAQAILTRLRLWQGEWFVNTDDGTPYMTEILGKRYQGKNSDTAIIKRILGTPGVQQIDSYSSSFNGDTRKLSFTATVSTAYGSTTISTTL